MPGTRHEQCGVSQVARQVRWHGCSTDEAYDVAGGRVPANEVDVYRGAPQGVGGPGVAGKKVVKPFCRREMAQLAVADRRVSIRLACTALDQRDRLPLPAEAVR